MRILLKYFTITLYNTKSFIVCSSGGFVTNSASGLVLVAIIGMVGLPSMTAYLSGHHTFYDISIGNCSECHYNNTQNIRILAVGFGLTTNPNDTGEAEVHKAFIVNGSNNACAACHTDVPVEVNFTKNYLLKFNATRSNDGMSNIGYFVGNFSGKGRIFWTYCNSSDNAFALGNSSYNWTPDTMHQH